MKITLDNITIIKNAEIEFSGLTVIAGKNDTGKTTVGRCLYQAVTNYMSIPDDSSRFIVSAINKSNDGTVIAGINKDKDFETYQRDIKEDGFRLFLQFESEQEIEQVILIDSPTTLDTFAYIKNAGLLFMQKRLFFNIDEHRTDLIVLLSQDITKKNKIPKKWFVQSKALYQKITHLIGGEVYYSKQKDNILYKKHLGKIDNKTLKIEKREFDKISEDDNFIILNISDTANGIKMFGYLQMLLLNNSLKKGSVLILDEPEVHLHPTWQLKYAEVIVELVKNEIKVLVNSHSPYMVEALQRYAEKEKIATDFYLAKDGYIQKQEDSNNMTLSCIFDELSEPFIDFDEMDSERLQNV